MLVYGKTVTPQYHVIKHRHLYIQFNYSIPQRFKRQQQPTVHYGYPLYNPVQSNQQSYTLCSSKVQNSNIMHLSKFCPTYPKCRQGEGNRRGFDHIPSILPPPSDKIVSLNPLLSEAFSNTLSPPQLEALSKPPHLGPKFLSNPLIFPHGKILIGT